MTDQEQKPKFYDGCAIETTDLYPVPISGIDISYQCPECKSMIERYELSFQKKQQREDVIEMLMRSGRTKKEAKTILDIGSDNRRRNNHD